MCWNCNHSFQIDGVSCPRCGAANANVDRELATAQADGEACFYAPDNDEECLSLGEAMAFLESEEVQMLREQKLRDEIVNLREVLERLLIEGRPEYCDRAYSCFSDGPAGWLAWEDEESSAVGGCLFSLCHCASEAQRDASDLLNKGVSQL